MLYTPPTPTPSAGALVAANNLSDVASAASARANLGVTAELEARDAAIAARAPLDYIQMDGATTNRAAGIYGPFDATVNRRGWIAGVPVLTILARPPVPTASSTSEIVGWSSSTTALASATAWSLGLAWSGNDLVLRANGATPATDSRTVTWTGFRTTYSGLTPALRVVVTAGTSTPTLEVNGAALAGTAADGAGTDPDWLSTSLVSTHRVVGFNWPAINAPTVIPILGTLTTAEADTWRLDGRLPAWVQAGGSAKDLGTTGKAYSFGAADGTTLISQIGGGGGGFAVAAVAGARTGGAGAQVFELTSGGSGSFLEYVEWGSFLNKPFTYRLWARRTAGAITGFRIGYTTAGGAAFNDVGGLTADWQFFQGVAWGRGGSGSGVSIGFPTGSVAGDKIEIDDLQITPGGALTIPVVQPCLVVGDGTLIGDNCGRILGGIPVTSRDRWRIVARTHTAAAQDVQVLGGPLFLEANRSRIDSAVAIQNSGGALNIAVGSTSGGTNIVASTEIATGSVPTELAPALRYPPTQNLFVRRVAGSGTGPFTVTLEGHRVGANP